MWTACGGRVVILSVSEESHAIPPGANAILRFTLFPQNDKCLH